MGELIELLLQLIVEGIGEFVCSFFQPAAEKRAERLAPERRAAFTQRIARRQEARTAKRKQRDNRRGAHFVWDGRRLADIEFLGGAAVQRASELSTEQLRVMLASHPSRTVRLGLRRYLERHRPGWRGGSAAS
jgi:hypothetical protein